MNLKSIGGYYFFFFSPIFGGRYMCRRQRQLTGSGCFFLPCGTQGSNSGDQRLQRHQPELQVPLHI